MVPCFYGFLGNWEISGKPVKSFDLITSTQRTLQETDFIFWPENCEKPTIKHSIEKAIFLNLVNFDYNIFSEIVVCFKQLWTALQKPY